MLRTCLCTCPCSQVYPGHVDLVGAPGHYVASAPNFAAGVDCLLTAGASVNVYTARGGTSFGFKAGGSIFGRNGSIYSRSFVSSYDFDAPLLEDGNVHPTKWAVLRNVFARHGAPINASTPPPSRVVHGSYGIIHMKQAVSALEAVLSGDFGKSVVAHTPKSFEALHHGYSYVLYSTRLPGNASGHMTFDARDRAWVAIDGALHGIAGWWRPAPPPGVVPRAPSPITIARAAHERKVDILVANFGRCCDALLDLGCGWRGLRGDVQVGTEFISSPWRMHTMPMTNLGNVSWKDILPHSSNCSQPLTLYRGTLDLPNGNAPRATYIRFDGWRSGVIVVNGNWVGRIDGENGPQRALYVPAAWLHMGRNEVIAFETGGSCVGVDTARCQQHRICSAPDSSLASWPQLTSVSAPDLGPPVPL